jgi:hypothetical protein
MIYYKLKTAAGLALRTRANSAPPVSSQKRTCHVPYSTTHVCVALTACADAAAVSAPSRARPTERCVQDPSRIRVEAHVLVAVAARSVRARKHSTAPLSSDRGSAATTVTCPSRRALSAVPQRPAQPTPPLDRSGAGSTPVTIYPKARAQHFSCPWRCDRPGVLPQQPAPAQLFSCKWRCERPCVLLVPPALQQPAPW